MTAGTDDPLRPTWREATEAWAVRVRAARAQIERLREVDDPADFYLPMARRFGQDPHRTDDPALGELLALARADETWLDIGAGGGRYSLPLALKVAHVHAVDPSASVLEVLREGMAEHGITNIDITAGHWPLPDAPPQANVALMAHVGYDIEGFATFLEAAEEATDHRCVVVMRAGDASNPGPVLWEEIHAEPRTPLPVAEELLALLVAHGVAPQVTYSERGTWGYPARDQLLEASRRQLWLRPGSEKDRHLQQLISTRAEQRDGQWSLEWRPMRDAIVTWQPAH